MVSAIKKWLGITKLEDENLILAKALKAHTERLDALESAPVPEKELTSEPPKPKIVAKRTNWRSFRSAAEKASEPEEQEA